jgi:RimJ/RimL family protein N-acetyltransferase
MNARTDLTISAVFADHPELSTARTRLRRVRWEDAGALFAYGSDPEVSRFVGWDTYQSLSDAEAYISTTLEKYEQEQLADWGIEHRRNRRFIGTIGFLWWETNEAAAEIGYVMAKSYWGQGIMTEVVQEVLRFGWDVMGLNRIQAHTEVENVGSQRVLEKCGLQYEGRLRERVHAVDGFVDLLVYAALRSNRDSRTNSIDGGR